MTSSEKMDVLLEAQVVTIYSRDIEMKDVVAVTQMAIMNICREKTLWKILYYTSITITTYLALESPYNL